MIMEFCKIMVETIIQVIAIKDIILNIENGLCDKKHKFNLVKITSPLRVHIRHYISWEENYKITVKMSSIGTDRSE